jgi:hypothetical protein
MAKASDNVFPRLLISEGGSTATPASGRVTMYAKTDGLLYSKDDAGAETALGGGSGTNLNPGTSFPGTPATNTLCFRTDRGILYFYNGTRWLSVHLYEHYLGQAAGISATTQYHTTVWTATYDVWVEDLIATMYCGSGLSGSAYWTLEVYHPDGASSGSVIASVNNTSGTNAEWVRKAATIDALMGTGVDDIYLQALKTSTPGSLYFGAMYLYRLVG